MDVTNRRKQEAAAWFALLRDNLCGIFEDIEDALTGTRHAELPAGRFTRSEWQHAEGGGGTSATMRGRVFEKIGINVSQVWGHLTPEFRMRVPSAGETGEFWAAGISLVAHLRSPLVPAVHMNTRLMATGKAWFGGGADLTPMLPESTEARKDAAAFHAALKKPCDDYAPWAYDKFSRWCDEYFFIKHRSEPRGTGGIFYDNLASDWEHDFAFTRAVGEAFCDIYPRLVRARMNEAWTEAQREAQLIKRGRYVEFNLLYDRGTMFGLQSGGNVEAILMSMPPEVRWP